MENGLRPIPSVIDLAGTLEVSGVNGMEPSRQAIKRRGLNAKLHTATGQGASLEGGGSLGMDKMGAVATKEVKRYDADGAWSIVVCLGWADVGFGAV